MIFYQIFNIKLIPTVEGAKVSPTSLENPALRAEGSHSESFLQSAVSSLQTKLIYEVFEAKIPFWLVGWDSGHRTEGVILEGGIVVVRREHNPENVRDKE